MGASSIRHCQLHGNSRVPRLVEFSEGDPELLNLINGRKAEISGLLLQYGGLLFRGFNVSQDTFGRIVDSLGSGRLNYVYRSTPRETVADRVFTSTIYPADREIPLHCENAYQRAWPMHIAFLCVKPSLKGGETPLADVIEVTQRIGPELLERFRRRGVRYVRNYRDGIDLPWAEVFQSSSRSEVERFCRENDIDFAWRSDEELRTSQICHGTAIHPQLKIELWFNQAHLFHVSSLGRDAERDAIDIFGIDGLPRNAFYGDGEPIASQDLELIRKAFANEATVFSWQEKDLLVLDNMQVAHGRRSYIGERRVLVAMSGLYGESAQDRGYQSN
jgi:alpha-ketoglutarate-dependent taurine dioxygenase